MTTATDELLLQVAESIAEGRPVDWAAVAAGADPATLARLREISALAGQFSVVKETIESKTRTAERAQRVWAHLELIEEIGRGSSGVVYRAYDPMLRRTVALKLCNRDRDDQEGLLREAQLMAKLDHVGALKIHGAALFEGQVGFWSDLVDGDSISSRLEREGRIAAQEAGAIGLELCAALAAMHALDLVHGDVKAQNVMRRGDGRHVLVDFGSSTPISERSHVSGTPLYLAPELLHGGPAAPADDLYSLGVLLFRMLSGKFPIEANTLLQLVECHRIGPRSYLVDLLPAIAPEFAAVIERSVSADPRARFRSAGEFAVALRSSLSGTQPLQASVPTSVELPSLAKPSRALLARSSFAIVAILLLVTSALSIFWWRHSEPEMQGFQARLIRIANGIEYPLLDGDHVEAGDALSLELQLERPGHVYVFNEDAAGAVFQLFPLPLAEQVNPLPAQKRLRLPGRIGGRDLDWLITSAGARERFYILVTPQAVSELAVAISGVAQAELGRPVDRSGLMATTRRVRGAGGLTEHDTVGAGFDWKVGDWLQQWRDRYPGATLQKLELENHQ